MIDEAYALDDKYKSGIWYDTYNGDFAKIQESDDGNLVELVNPETDSVYWDMPVSEWVEEEQSDFRPVPTEAVEDPVAVVNRAVRNLAESQSEIPMEEEIAIRYAREQVEISESMD